MTPEEALNMMFNTLRKVSLGGDDHDKIKEAFAIIKNALDGPCDAAKPDAKDS